MIESDDREWQRIRWHCRRGLLEVDIVLQRFLDCYAGRISGPELDSFKDLLELPDNDLWDLIVGRTQTERPEWRGLVEQLRQV